VIACDVSYRAPRLVVGVEGTGFLWNQVRIMVGTLVEVGLGRYAASAVQEMLSKRDRRSAGGTAPAHGLYLQWIKYKTAAPATPSNGIGPPGADGG
jgi:tRNA pseudouridine38-40 synthase